MPMPYMLDVFIADVGCYLAPAGSVELVYCVDHCLVLLRSSLLSLTV